MKLGANLILICKQKGLSLASVARKANIPPQTLHAWSVGRNGVNLSHLKRIAMVLEISIHELVFGEPDPYQKVGNENLQEIFSGDVRITIHRINNKSE